MRLAKGRTAAVRGVLEDAPHAGAVPPVFAGAGRHLPRTQAPCDLAEARALLAYPGEDLLHHLRLLGDDLVARLAAALPAADVAVAVGRPAEHVDATALRPMALAPTAALEDLGPLVLGDHALDLQQELLLGIVPHGMVEEDDLDPGAAKLVDQQHLIGVLARQAIGRVDIEALDRPQGNRIAQPLQRRPHQCGPTVAVVDEGAFSWHGASVRRAALLQRARLAGDGLRRGLSVRGHARIERRSDREGWNHEQRAPTQWGGSRVASGSRAGSAVAMGRRMVGTTCA